jgi:hypothetical protein
LIAEQLIVLIWESGYFSLRHYCVCRGKVW